jgi:hypothetical protein
MHVWIFFANMIHIRKEHLSAKAMNRIRRLAAFSNPAFYKNRALHVSNWKTPRILYAGEETDEYISIPRGAMHVLASLLEDSGAGYSQKDLRRNGSKIEVDFVGELREEQVPAADAMLAEDIGILSATTAFGKTVIGAYMIANRKVAKFWGNRKVCHNSHRQICRGGFRLSSAGYSVSCDAHSLER